MSPREFFHCEIEIEDNSGLTKTSSYFYIYIHNDAGHGVQSSTGLYSRRTKRHVWRIEKYSVPTPPAAKRKYAEYVYQKILCDKDWLNLPINE